MTQIPRDPGGRFVNWARTVTSAPSAWHEPANDDELAELVRGAARAGRRVRVVGSGHSWSAAAAPAPGGLAVSLASTTGVTLDRAGSRAVVRGGTTLAELLAMLARNGFTLPIVGSITAQAIAGAIATGTHGSSLVHGNLASLVDELQLVDGTGERVVLAAGDPRLAIARVHLGALGAVTTVGLRIEPSFRLAETVEAMPVARVAAALPAIAASAEYVKVWWLPHTRDAFVFRYARTTDRETTWPSAATRRWIDETLVHARVLPVVSALQRRWPGAIAPINQLFARTLATPRRVGVSTLMLGTPMPVLHRETEAAVPVARGGEAFDRLVALIARERVRVNFIVEARFVRGDDTALSPAFGGDVCQLGAYSSDLGEADRYFAAFWRELEPLGARPHWGKELAREPLHDAAALAARYPRFAEFRALRDQLDPQRTFGSPFLDRVLGPGA